MSFKFFHPKTTQVGPWGKETKRKNVIIPNKRTEREYTHLKKVY